MSDKDVPPIEPEAIVDTETPEEPPKPEVTLEEVQKQVGELTGNLTKAEENWKNAQRDSSKKQDTIQNLREQLQSNDSTSTLNKALVALMSQQKGQPAEEFAEEVKQNSPDLVKQFEATVAKIDGEQQAKRMTTRLREVQQRTEAVGLTPKDDDYDVIQTFAEAGKFGKVEKMLDKLEESKQAPKAETKKSEETEDEKVNRLVQEGLRKEMEKKGLLTQEDGGPSASASKRDEVLAKVASGELSTKEAEKIGFTFS